MMALISAFYQKQKKRKQTDKTKQSYGDETAMSLHWMISNTNVSAFELKEN